MGSPFVSVILRTAGVGKVQRFVIFKNIPAIGVLSYNYDMLIGSSVTPIFLICIPPFANQSPRPGNDDFWSILGRKNDCGCIAYLLLKFFCLVLK